LFALDESGQTSKAKPRQAQAFPFRERPFLIGVQAVQAAFIGVVIEDKEEIIHSVLASDLVYEMLFEETFP
jgi:hypothetical protein